MSFYRRLFRYGLAKIEFGSLKVNENFPGGESYTLSGTKPGYQRRCASAMRIFTGIACSTVKSVSARRTWRTRGKARISTRPCGGLHRTHFLPGFSGSGATQWFMNILGFTNRIRHFLRPNTQRISRRNIAAHYDIGNPLYELMLGRTMAYSGGVFANPQESLDKAQERKFGLICEKLQLSKKDHLLEIGSGWGGFAVYAAKNFGCKVTTVTISEQQYDYAKLKIQAAKLGHLIDLQLRDYRLLRGQVR